MGGDTVDIDFTLNYQDDGSIDNAISDIEKKIKSLKSALRQKNSRGDSILGEDTKDVIEGDIKHINAVKDKIIELRSELKKPISADELVKKPIGELRKLEVEFTRALKRANEAQRQLNISKRSVEASQRTGNTATIYGRYDNYKDDSYKLYVDGKDVQKQQAYIDKLQAQVKDLWREYKEASEAIKRFKDNIQENTAQVNKDIANKNLDIGEKINNSFKDIQRTVEAISQTIEEAGAGYGEGFEHYASDAQKELIRYEEALAEIELTQKDLFDYRGVDVIGIMGKWSKSAEGMWNLYRQRKDDERELVKLEEEEKQLNIQIADINSRLVREKAESSGNGRKEATEEEKILQTAINILKVKRQQVQAEKEVIKQSVDYNKSQQDKNSGSNNNAARNNYYLLRAVKMFGEQLDRTQRKMEDFTKNVIKGTGRALKAIMALGSGMLLLHRNTDKATKSTRGFGDSLKYNLKHILSYTLGIRSIFVLFQRLRSSMSQGLQWMALGVSDVNKQMSSLLTSLNWMKASIATAVQPLLNILAPALEKIAALFNKAAVAVGSFFAALTGQKFVYTAVKTQQDYAASLGKTASAAKDAKKQLSGLDKLNVLNSDNDSGGDDGAGIPQFKTEKIAADYNKLADKIKKIFKKFFSPLKKAWDKEGKFVMDAFKFAVENVWGLMKDIGRDFLDVWANDTGVAIWENILHIAGDVLATIGWIALKLRLAWNENKTGKKILEEIQKMIKTITDGIRDAADYTVKWAATLDFTPLFQAFLTLLEDLQGPLKVIVDLAVYFWENVVLKFTKYMVEKGLPLLLEKIDGIVKAIDWDKLHKNVKRFMDAFEPFLEKFWEALMIVLGDVGDVLAKFVNSKAFQSFVDKLIKWMDEADPEKMAKSIEKFAKTVIILGGALKIFGGAKTKIQNFLEFSNLILQFKNAGGFGGLFAGAKKAVGGFKLIAGGVGDLIGTVATSIGTFASTTLPGLISAATPFLEFALIAFATAAVTGLGATIKECYDAFEENQEAANNRIEMAMDDYAKIYSEKGKEAADAWAEAALDIEIQSEDLNGALSEINSGLQKEMEDWGLVPENAWEGFKQAWHDTWSGKNLGEIVETAFGKEEGGLLGMVCKVLGIASPSKEMEDIGDNTVEGYYIGFKEKWGDRFAKIKLSWDGLKKTANSKLNSNTIKSNGTNTAGGFGNGFSSKWPGVFSTISSNFSSIKTDADSKLSWENFKNIGSNIVQGLKDGIVSKWENLKASVKDTWDNITNSATGAYEVNSPSRVFRRIGEYLIEGLYQGVEEDSDSFGEIFKSMVPDADVLDTFYTKFVDMFAQMRQDTVSIVESMFIDIENVIARIERLDAARDIVNSLSNIDIPKITQGITLPTSIQADMAKSNDSNALTLSNLPDMIKEAFVEAILETADNSGDKDIVVNIDGREIFKVVQKENSAWKKRHGVTAFA